MIHTITEKPVKLIGVEVPVDAYDFAKYYKDSSPISLMYLIHDSLTGLDLPELKIIGFDFELLGFAYADTIDFDCEPYVEKTKHYSWGGFGHTNIEDVFVNYEHLDTAICRSANDSPEA